MSDYQWSAFDRARRIELKVRVYLQITMGQISVSEPRLQPEPDQRRGAGGVTPAQAFIAVNFSILNWNEELETYPCKTVKKKGKRFYHPLKPDHRSCPKLTCELFQCEQGD